MAGIMFAYRPHTRLVQPIDEGASQGGGNVGVGRKTAVTYNAGNSAIHIKYGSKAEIQTTGGHLHAQQPTGIQAKTQCRFRLLCVFLTDSTHGGDACHPLAKTLDATALLVDSQQQLRTSTPDGIAKFTHLVSMFNIATKQNDATHFG